MAKTLVYASDSPTYVKISDTDTNLYLQLAKDGTAVDLSTAKSIDVKIADKNENYLKDISINPANLPNASKGVLILPLNSENISGLPAGQYAFEVWVETADSQQEIYPDAGMKMFTIFNNVICGTTVIAQLTLQTFEDKFTDIQTDLQNKVNSGYFKGAKGDTGDKGDKGDTGPKGLDGAKGDKGDTGPQGLQGEKGDVGPQGLQGIVGDTGPQGLQGEKGDVGPQGLQGIVGDTGPKGDKGDTGTVDNAGLTSAPAFQALQTQVDDSAVGENLLTGTSGNLVTATNATGWASNLPSVLINGNDLTNQTYTASAYIAPEKHDVSLYVSFAFNDGSYKAIAGNTISAGSSGYSTLTTPVPLNGYLNHVWLSFTSGQGDSTSVSYKEIKLELGSHATPWCPNPSEILTQSDYAKIKAAIVALGGSL